MFNFFSLKYVYVFYMLKVERKYESLKRVLTITVLLIGHHLPVSSVIATSAALSGWGWLSVTAGA